MENLSIVRTPELIAHEINDIKIKTQKMLLYNSIEIGRRLTEAKSLVEHGEWGEWLEQSVDYSKSTANNLMRIFEEYGADQITLLDNNIKNDAFSKLSYSQAVALLGMPEEEKEAFIQKNDVENMSTRELQQAIKERDEALKAKEKAEKDKEKIQKDLDALQKEKTDSADKISRLQTEIVTINNKLKEARASGNDNEIESLHESMKVLDDELSEAKRKNEELERQLMEKPIEAAATKEVIPPDVEKELEELRKKVGSNDESVVKFKVCFEQVKKTVAELALSLDEIEDPETKEKYRGAAKKFLNILQEKL